MNKQEKIQKITDQLQNNPKIPQQKKAEIFDKIQEMNSSSLDILIDFLENFSEDGADDALWEINRRRVELKKYSEKVFSGAKKEVLEIAEEEEDKKDSEILDKLEDEIVSI